VFPVGDTNHATLFRSAPESPITGVRHDPHAARSGVPQFIMPRSQTSSTGAPGAHAGLGPAPLSPLKSHRGCWAGFLELCGNPHYIFNARTLGKEMRFENGIPAVVSIITSRANGTAELKGADLACRI